MFNNYMYMYFLVNLLTTFLQSVGESLTYPAFTLEAGIAGFGS